jgi:hypothetical protein
LEDQLNSLKLEQHALLTKYKGAGKSDLDKALPKYMDPLTSSVKQHPFWLLIKKGLSAQLQNHASLKCDIVFC